MEAYKDDQTPFLSKHKCGKEARRKVSTTTFIRSYAPTQPVQVGDSAAACYGAVKVVGKIQQIVRKYGKKYVIFTTKADKQYLYDKCVKLPVANEFIRHKQTKTQVSSDPSQLTPT